MVILKTLNKYFKFCFLIIFLTTCKEGLITLSPPQIEVISFEEIAFGKFEIDIALDLGERQQIKKAEIILEDITVTASTNIIKDLSITDKQNQIISVLIDNAKPNHDYKTYAKITTDEYEFLSEFKILRASKNIFTLELLKDDYYSDYDNNISNTVNRGDSLIALFYFQSDIKNKEVEIKLNKTIKVDHNLLFDGDYTYAGENKILIGQIYIPANIESGDYEVYAYIDGTEIKANTKIRVLKGIWNLFDKNFPGEELAERAWFVKGNNLIIAGGAPTWSRPSSFPVWKYDLTNKIWKQMKDFTSSKETEDRRILSYSNFINNEGYILFYVNNAPIEIWKYNEEDDTWVFITNYPIYASEYHLNFSIANKLYISGLTRPEDWINNVYQVWSFDFEEKKWERLNNLPATIEADFNETCSTKDKVYIFERSNTNRMWEYNPANDTWKLMSRFPGPKRENSNLIEKDGNIYLIGGNQIWGGGITLRDCWKFSPSTNTWNLNSFIPKRSQCGIAFCWNSKIIYGMSYYQNWDLTYDSFLYELNSN
ncbi:MAG TPA: hypothetical protein VLQ91_18005 [Draconibacterium sp.]|nr:hypothetical protein [Draconibacterium sp.]